MGVGAANENAVGEVRADPQGKAGGNRVHMNHADTNVYELNGDCNDWPTSKINRVVSRKVSPQSSDPYWY
jgi:hypothetical protein